MKKKRNMSGTIWNDIANPEWWLHQATGWGSDPAKEARERREQKEWAKKHGKKKR